VHFFVIQRIGRCREEAQQTEILSLVVHRHRDDGKLAAVLLTLMDVHPLIATPAIQQCLDLLEGRIVYRHIQGSFPGDLVAEDVHVATLFAQAHDTTAAVYDGHDDFGGLIEELGQVTGCIDGGGHLEENLE
jgi:hypothetical protein